MSNKFLYLLRGLRCQQQMNKRMMSSSAENDVYKDFRPFDSTAVIKGRKGHKPIIKEFVRLAYMKGDPLLMANSMTDDLELLNFWIDYECKENLSLIAYDKNNGQVIGVAVGSDATAETNDDSKATAVKTIQNSKAFRMACLFDDMPEKLQLLDKFKVKHVYDLHILATHPEYTRKGVAKYLLLHCRALAREAGYPLLRLVCTNSLSVRLALKQGMEQFSSREAISYIDREGKPWVQAMAQPPNQNLTILYDRLDPTLTTFFKPPPPKKSNK